VIGQITLIEIYTIRACGLCSAAREILRSHGLEYTEYDVTADSVKRREMLRRSRNRGLPQIFINGEFVGSYHELGELMD
jgi:glutaredoxin 3